ncbi:MAG: heavy-metal-associated domain-containing protein [Actinomycetes bacterium]
MTTTTYAVTGMTCGHCEAAVAKEVLRIPGVTGAVAHAEAGTVEVTSDAPVDRAALAEAVSEAGYSLAG